MKEKIGKQEGYVIGVECRETERLVQRYIKGELDGKKLRDFLEHIRSCQDCYEELEIYYTITEGLQHLESGSSVDVKKDLSKSLRLSEQKVRIEQHFFIYRILIETLAMIALFLVLIFQINYWVYGTTEIDLFERTAKSSTQFEPEPQI